MGWLHRQLAEGSADVGVAHNIIQQRVHMVLRQPLEIVQILNGVAVKNGFYRRNPKP